MEDEPVPVMSAWLSRVNERHPAMPFRIVGYEKPGGVFTKCVGARAKPFVPVVSQVMRQGVPEYVIVGGVLEGQHFGEFHVVPAEFPELDGNLIEDGTLCVVHGITDEFLETHVVKMCVPEIGTPYFVDTGVHEAGFDESGYLSHIVETDH